ncbi:MAG: hypothetical protein ACFCVC_10170 [Acidimicrobiia bacterium]
MSGRRSTLILVCALALSACSESSLSELGGRSSEWIGSNASATAAGPAAVEQNVVRSVEVDWVNDGLGSPASIGSPEEVLAAMVARTTGPDRYIQASRLEVATSLPGLGFPDVLPPEVVAITSQLVVAANRERLDDEVFAAFGLWTVEPYTKSRSVGQRGTFTVTGIQPDSACERFAAGAVAACTSETIGAHETVRIDAESGQTWVWFDETYEYQLFLRGPLDKNGEIADFMVRNEVSFVSVADPTARVLGTQVTATEEEPAAEDGEDQ